MREYTYTLTETCCTIRDVKTGVPIRQLSRGGEKIKNVLISGDSATIITNFGTYVYNINTGSVIRQFK